MATISEDLRTFLLADATIASLVGTRVHQDTIPDAARSTYPRIWFRKANVENEPDIDATVGLTMTTFDVEILTDDISEIDTVTDAVRTRLHGALGTFGSRTAKGVFVEDQGDDYIPFGLGDDEGTHFAALSVLVI